MLKVIENWRNTKTFFKISDTIYNSILFLINKFYFISALTNGYTKLNENHNEDINDSVRQNGSTKSDDCIQNSNNAVIANAINWNSDWQCNNCRKSIPNSEVQKILEAVHEELLLLDRDNIDSCKR